MILTHPNTTSICAWLEGTEGLCSVVMPQVSVKPKASRTKKPTARLTTRQLRRLADRMVASNDPGEVARLKAELERGFYGDPVHA